MPMRLTEFHRCVRGEFGEIKGEWILHSHVLASRGDTAEELLAQGVEPREIWWEICEDFEIPELRRLGPDD